MYLDFVLETAKKVFATEDIDPDTRFREDLNAKSLSIAQLMSAIEDEYDVEVPYMDISRKKTIAEVADFIQALLED